MPLAIVACNLETGEKVVFKEGSVSQAVRASISIPGVFVPHENRWQAIGGWSGSGPHSCLCFKRNGGRSHYRL